MSRVDNLLARPHLCFCLVDDQLQAHPGALDGLSLEELAELAGYYEAIATILRLEPDLDPRPRNANGPTGREPTAETAGYSLEDPERPASRVAPMSPRGAEIGPETANAERQGAHAAPASVRLASAPKRSHMRRPSNPRVHPSLNDYVSRSHATFEHLQHRITQDAERGFEKLGTRGSGDLTHQLR